MDSVMIVASFLITLGGVVTVLIMCAGLLSGNAMKDAAILEPMAHDLEEVSSSSY